VLGELGRYAESETHFREAVERMPDFADAHARLAFVEARQGRVREALERYRMAKEMEPGSQAVAMGLHMILLAQGDRAGAIRVLQEALAHNPDDIMLANNAAWQLATSPRAELRDGSEAVRLAEHARALEGETVSPDVLDTLAAAYAEAGRFEDAARTARRAVEVARQAGRDSLAEDVRSRLALYEASKPFREPQ
jgi:Flp pilus assembly protein TadD